MTMPGRERCDGHRVLLVGGKPDRALHALRDLGASVTCVASVKHAAKLSGGALVDAAVAVRNPADAEDVMLGLSRHGIRVEEFDVVTSALEFGLVAASVIGSAVSVRSLPLRTAVLLRDKPSQKRALLDAGIRVASSEVFVAPDDLEGAVARVGGLPVVVKPTDGAGAGDTEMIRSADDLRGWSARARPRPWLCESFVVGDELHLDGVVRNGTLRSVCTSRYFAPMIGVYDGELSGSAMLGAERSDIVSLAAETCMAQVVAALDLQDCVFHAEMFEQADGSVVFGEIGGRVGGGRIDEMVRRGTGVDLHSAWAAAALGVEEAFRADRSPGLVFGNLDLRTDPGTIVTLPSVEEIMGRSGVVDAELKLRPGDSMEAVADTNTRAGRAVFAADTWSQAREAAVTLDAWFRSRTVLA
ncbi:ATP-grasp domain-containing protein [Rhodococcus sp. SBT000017]|uniref:ATP-grasp domain-containing protein n=2 Tax=unclassified Rhodococcus (in: high G+C Gram-positive bacteria) TaxID=192944 RepID=UPI000B09AE17|nr:ATP-grasp domain-containing protein [Rhodococcus sp. SBT000017]RMB71744.1 ATP-grasp domain-containing protein [Rhodococcus sp. SBT000017]